jgi:hypothetical protein
MDSFLIEFQTHEKEKPLVNSKRFWIRKKEFSIIAVTLSLGFLYFLKKKAETSPTLDLQGSFSPTPTSPEPLPTDFSSEFEKQKDQLTNQQKNPALLKSSQEKEPSLFTPQSFQLGDSLESTQTQLQRVFLEYDVTCAPQTSRPSTVDEMVSKWSWNLGSGLPKSGEIIDFASFYQVDGKYVQVGMAWNYDLPPKYSIEVTAFTNPQFSNPKEFFLGSWDGTAKEVLFSVSDAKEKMEQIHKEITQVAGGVFLNRAYSLSKRLEKGEKPELESLKENAVVEVSGGIPSRLAFDDVVCHKDPKTQELKLQCGCKKFQDVTFE